MLGPAVALRAAPPAAFVFDCVAVLHLAFPHPGPPALQRRCPATHPQLRRLPSARGPLRGVRSMAGSALDASSGALFGKGYAPGQEGSEKLVSAPATRNTEPIIDVLKTVMPSAPGKVLGVAEGSGQHVSSFAKAFPHMTFQPTEIEPPALKSQQLYIDEAGVTNVLAPTMFDCLAPEWGTVEAGGDKYSVIYAINLTHVSPWEATLGLFAAAKRLLQAGGLVVIYGPFKVNGGFTSDSNKEFDTTLRTRNEKFGYRDIADIEKAAQGVGMTTQKVVDMPANNHMLIFKMP